MKPLSLIPAIGQTELSRFSQFADDIFSAAVISYHILDDMRQAAQNPYREGTIEALLYNKCWTDTVQWHTEDEIRDVNIAPVFALELKRAIDALNQQRTNLVEQLDDYFLHCFQDTPAVAEAKVNTESPAWAIDRLSILRLKIYHMQVEVQRPDATPEHLAHCRQKLTILLEQQVDLLNSINELLNDIANGSKVMRVYRQVKMYNDPSLNPVLYKTAVVN